ncbi:nuclear transport factor 2 family protein [Geodermatophilus sp. SYSU D00758]
MTDLLDLLLGLERRGWDSLCDGTAADLYGELMTEDALFVLADGSVMDRSTVVAALSGSPAWRSYAIEDPRLVALGPDAAALVYTGRASRGEGEPEFVGAMSSSYVRTGDRWRLALYTQTPVPSAEPSRGSSGVV